MRKNGISVLGVIAAALAFAGGCSCVNNEASRRPGTPVGEVAAGKAASEVLSELVYDLGDNVIANSLSVTMAGGYLKPRPFKKPGGVDVCCEPPQGGGPTSGRDKPPAAAGVPAPVSPVADVVDGSSEPQIDSGAGMSDIFTLTDEELRNGPEVYHPGSGQLWLEEARKAPIAEPAHMSVDAATPESAAREEELAVVAPAVPAVAPPPALPVDLALPEQPSVQADKYAAMKQILPPLPAISDLEGAAEAMLSRDADEASSLPAVELPPKLN